MNKTLLKDISEYRQWAWDLVEEEDDQHVEKALGLCVVRECWDVNEKGEEIDEEGNVIPDDTAETVKLEDWVNKLQFPVVAVYCFEKEWDRHGSAQIVFAEFVELKEFNV